MPVEFLGIAATHDGSEVTARSGGAFDKQFALRLARAHEDNGWDRVLFAYSSASPDPGPVAAWVAARTDTLQLLLAHRPNVSAPTFAAKTFATIDQISDGRLGVHFITGGSTADQAAEGDFLAKDDRYARTREYIDVVRRAWTSTEPFDHEGRFYRFSDFVADVRPVRQPHPTISFGGSSAAAYAAGGAVADVYALWGEPLAATAEQIRAVHAAARAAGREQPPRIQAAFRPIIAPTDELAWEKAARVLDRVRVRVAAGGGALRRHRSLSAPENAGSQRLLAIAAEGDRFDTALWTAPARETGGGGNSNALVGTPETVARALLAYYDLGVDIVSARGYDLLDDAVDFGRYVIPLVREGVAARDAAGAPRGVDRLESVLGGVSA